MSGLFNSLLSRRDAATVPSMDGVLRPNAALDQASILASAPEPDNLVRLGTELVFSSGNDILSLSGDGRRDSAPRLLHHFEARVTALAVSPGGALAVGLDGVGVRLIRGIDQADLPIAVGPRPVRGPSAVAFDGEDTLVVCIGSAQNAPEDWQRDLMEMRATGSLWRVDLGSKAAVCIADGLAFPNGILVRGDAVVISESWSHRLLSFDAKSRKGRPEVILEDLPGYPGRLAPAADGGAWLAVFAPRSQLIEFVLRERAYCARMLREIPRELWIAPAFRSGASFREPMQGGAVRVHGIFKPWAPTRSYGLAVQLDKDLAPVRSFHSRADGGRHGIVSLCEWEGSMVFGSRGGSLLGSLPMLQSVAQDTVQ